MGVNTRKPPLPAPTDVSTSDNYTTGAHDTDLATDISRRTDKTSYSVPEDGSPVVIPTKKHQREQSQTSLLIEYFEGSKKGEGKVQHRPSVRVRVTPSSGRRSKQREGEHVQITETNPRKPSYTRRISLGKKEGEGTELSASDGSTISGPPPVDIEVLQRHSDLSSSDRETRFVPLPSDVSSMPPDSLLHTSVQSPIRRQRSRSLERQVIEDSIMAEKATLKAPKGQRSRSLSRERIMANVMEKLQAENLTSPLGYSGSSRHKAVGSKDSIGSYSSTKRRSSKQKEEDYFMSGTESSLMGSGLDPKRASGETGSIRSGVSNVSSINNPKLLQTVEDAIRRLILPELNALKEEQRSTTNLTKFEERARETVAAETKDRLKRRSSRQASESDVSKPKVVLNREGDDPGTVLSRGDSVRQDKPHRHRRSSHGSGTDRSYSRRSSRGSVEKYSEDGEKVRRKKSKDKSHRSRDAAVGAVIGAGLTAAALKAHDSQSTMDSTREKRKKRHRSKSKSRSRTASFSESQHETVHEKEPIPPMPMQSMMDSELTRDSLISHDTEQGASTLDKSLPPVQEVRRHTPVASPTTRTPTRTPVKDVNSSRTRDIHELHSPTSDRSVKARAAAFASGATSAAALAAASRGSPKYTSRSREYLAESPSRGVSPVQSDASYRHEEEHYANRIVSPVSATKEGHRSTASLDDISPTQSPSALRIRRPQGVNFESPSQILAGDVPDQRDVDEWLDQEHELNEQYRSEISQRDYSDTEANRLTQYTDDSMDADFANVKGVGINNAEFVHAPHAVESAIASLVSDQSTQSSGLKVAQIDRSQANSASGERNLPVEQQVTPALEGDTLVPGESTPIKEYWNAIREQAQRTRDESLEKERMSAGTRSPPQSPARTDKSSHLDLAATTDPTQMQNEPEIGWYPDDESDINTNPSIIRGPLDEQAHRFNSYPESPRTGERAYSDVSYDDRHESAEISQAQAYPIGTAAAVGGAATIGALASQAIKDSMQPTVDDYSPRNSPIHENIAPGNEVSPSPQSKGDEGYMSSAPRAAGFTPDLYNKQQESVPKLFDEADLENFDPNAPIPPLPQLGSAGDSIEDPFATTRHVRHMSGNSHGLASPLYDSATGKGMELIQSKDIVALMDHLTVRDAQRNARDTEILITLVRSAAEMRNSFEEMKRYIAEQDKIIMAHQDRNTDKIIQGPRPQPLGSPRFPRQARSSDAGTDAGDDLPARRRNVFRRALKGLSKNSSNDLGKIEDMLMHLLGEVEGLKDSAAFQRSGTFNSQLHMNTSGSAGINSYDNLRSAPIPTPAVGTGTQDPGYEPEGQAGTSSTPNQSNGNLSLNDNGRYSGMHSGYDGRRGSENRISTVMEGDEDELADHEAHILAAHPQLSPTEERLLTPTQEVARGAMTPPRTQVNQRDSFEQTPKGRSKHKSNSSSLFGIPKISRWSRTTASTDQPQSARNSRDTARPAYPSGLQEDPTSDAASRSGSQVDMPYYNDEHPYALEADDRLPSTESLRRDRSSYRSQYSSGRDNRPPSPLIPSDLGSERSRTPGQAEYMDDEGDWMYPDDPKYQAHRNSINFEHPQPRQGTTGRHQNQLETAAHGWNSWDDESSSVRSGEREEQIQWGSNPSLARQRYSGGPGHMGAHGPSPLGRVAEDRDDDGPLMPNSAQHQRREEEDRSPQNLNTWTGGGGNYAQRSMYSSPPGSGGHLPTPLAPIEEVRYSLETDRGLTPSPASLNGQRKITPIGPRAMGSRSPIPREEQPPKTSGTTRRKPVAARSWGE